jgi:hypothetical protein
MGSCEYGNEPAGCIEVMEFLHWFSDSQLLKRTLFHGTTQISR